MTRLIRVELRRLSARRLVVLAMLGSLVVTGLLLVALAQSLQPMSPAESAQAERSYQEALAHWEEFGQEQVEQCRQEEQREQERTGEAVDFGCEQMEPQREWFVHTNPPLHENLPLQLGSLSYLLLLLGLVVGATFTAAELATGAMGNWLTFEPRRGRVYTSKLVAAGLGVLPAALLVLGVFTGGAWLLHQAQDLTGGMTAERWAETGWMLIRIVGLTTMAALVGAALGFLLRHTAAVLGLVVGYVVVVEGMFSGLLSRLQPWLVLNNLDGWVNHGTTYAVEECTTDTSGMVCQYTEQALGFGPSAAYVLGLTALVVALGVLVFRRRDVG